MMTNDFKQIRHRLYFGCTINTKYDTLTINQTIFNFFCRESVDSRLDSYTVTKGRGVWNGTHEDCFILEFILPINVGDPLAKAIAHEYCREFAQEAVLHTAEMVESELLN
jgi:hypothetical protein